jgi:hypothetical protein
MLHRQIKRPVINRWSIIGLLLLLNLIGCAVSEPDARNSSDTVTQAALAATTTVSLMTPSATSAIAPSTTPTATVTATPVPSFTPAPTIPSPTVTATSTPTPWPTLPPLPTIPPQQRGQVYRELMNSNGGCELPCWWGFELGKATEEQVKQFYNSLGAYIFEREYPDGYSIVETLFVDPQIEDGIQVRHMFLAQDGIIIEAEVQVRSQPDYQIEPILQRFGQPSEVWMWTIPEPYEGILPTRFRLYFPEQGILVLYGTGGVRIGDEVNVCFDRRGGAILLLWDPEIWDPDGTKGLIERANDSSELTLEGDHPIEEVSNWNAEQFYTVLTDPTRSDCLLTPSELWPAP